MATYINQDLRGYYYIEDEDGIEAHENLIAQSLTQGYKKDGSIVKLAYDIKDALEGRK
jgi:hypothetical protein